MKRIVTGIALAAVALLVMPAGAQVVAKDVQQKLAAAKAAAARNQKALRSYSWIETTELSLKGEVKNNKVDMCKYGPDGKVQRTPVLEPAPTEKKRGLKGKIIAKKTGEMKEELEAAIALVQQYVPPSPDLMQVVMDAGTASLSQAGPGAASLKFPAYVKKGDALTLTFDSNVNALRQIEVNTWLDEPESVVNLKVMMQAMTGGISYPGLTVVTLVKRQLEVKIVKSNYQKIVQ
jgi:hypothetical protein